MITCAWPGQRKIQAAAIAFLPTLYLFASLANSLFKTGKSGLLMKLPSKFPY